MIRVMALACIASVVSCLSAKAADPNDYFDMSIEELMEIEVQSAAFFPTTTAKAPGYAIVYDMNEVRDGSARTLSDLMELYVPGVAMGAHERQGRLVGVRGLEIDNNAKTLVMWDGEQINYRSHYGYMVGMLSPFLGDVSRVEVIHGPGAIQHGSGAINGFVNLVPKTGSSDPGLYSHYEYGFMEQSNLIETGYGLQYGQGRDLYVYGGGYAARGFEPDNTYGVARNYTDDIDAFGFAEDNYRFSTTWNHDHLSLNWWTYSLHPHKNSTNESGYFMNRAMGVRPKYTFELGDTESVDLIGAMEWMDFGVFGHNGEDVLKGGSERHTQIMPIFKTTRIERHQIALGGLYGYKKFRNADFYLDGDPFGGFESIDAAWHEAGVFAEDIISLTDRLTLSLGLRYDEYSLGTMSGFWPEETVRYTPEEMDGHFSPRLALAFAVDETTNVKGSYQHGFRMPDVAYYQFNLYNNGIAEGLGYPTYPLEPETMDSWTVNIEKIFCKRLEGGLNLFYNTFNDQLSWGPLTNSWTAEQATAISAVSQAPWGMFQNSDGRFDVWGAEVLAKYKLTDSTTIGASYGFADVVNNEIEQRYPPHQVKLNVASRFLQDRLLVGVDYVFNSHYTHEINPTIADYYEDSRHLVNASVVYKVTENLRLKGVVQNLFADRTPPSAFLMNDPSKGNLGYDDTRVYLSAELRF